MTTKPGGELVIQSPVPVKWKSPFDGSVDVNDALSRKSSTGGGNRTHPGVPVQRILSPQRLPYWWHRRHVGVTLKLLGEKQFTRDRVRRRVGDTLG